MELLLPVLIASGMGVFLYLLLRGLDREDLRRHPAGLVSESGLRGVVGGGFVFGFAWGALTGWGEGAGWFWLLRGLTVGFMVASAGAFYLGIQQRAHRRRREDAGPPPAVSEGEDPEEDEFG